MALVHAYIEVTVLPDGINFYCRGLGLTLKRRLSPTWVELTGANLPIYLLANRPPHSRHRGRRQHNTACIGGGSRL
jgi:hypothetical protein